jgi:hypothetical protein
MTNPTSFSVPLVNAKRGLRGWVASPPSAVAPKLAPAPFNIVYGILYNGQPLPEFERVNALDRQNARRTIRTPMVEAISAPICGASLYVHGSRQI